MKKLLAGVSVALALGISTAYADGIDKKYSPIASPAPVFVPTWTGFYIGAGVGAGIIVHDHSIRDVDFGNHRFNGIGADGVFGTAIVGWDWQIGPKGVFGLFADYDFHDNNNDFSLFDGLIRTSFEHDNIWSVGARLGVLTSPSTLWYATAGYTEAQIDTNTTLSFDGGDFSFSRDRTFSGWFVGGGIDTRLAASNWFLRLEYRFSQFDDERVLRDEFTTIDLEPTLHTTRLTLTYKFSGGGYGSGYGFSSWGR
jgi:outer membrane immunogenic protein